MAVPTILYVTAPTIATNADGTSAVSGAYTPTADRLILAIGLIVRGSGTADAWTLAHSGDLGTMTLMSLDQLYNNNAVNGGRVRAFYGYSSGAPTAGTFTMTCTNTHTSFILQVFEIDGAHADTPEGQLSANSGGVNGTGPTTATLGDDLETDSLVLGIWSSENGGAATITGPAAAGWAIVEAADLTDASSSVAASASCRHVVWKNDAGEVSAEFTTSSSADHLVAIMEIAAEEAAAPGGGDSGAGNIVPARVRPILVVPI